jgi:hypothetical protein
LLLAAVTFTALYTGYLQGFYGAVSYRMDAQKGRHRKTATRLGRKRNSSSRKKGFSACIYLILRKLEYYREGRSEKHLRDIAGILEVSGGLVNAAWLEEQIAERQLQEEWQAARRSLDYL